MVGGQFVVAVTRFRVRPKPGSQQEIICGVLIGMGVLERETESVVGQTAWYGQRCVYEDLECPEVGAEPLVIPARASLAEILPCRHWTSMCDASS